MRTLERAAQERMHQGYKERMAALEHWFHGKTGGDTCPNCFSTWISVCFTNGWESLSCCECGAQGPLPKECIVEMQTRAIAIALVLAPRRPRRVRAQVCIIPPSPRKPLNQRRLYLNVAW